MKERAALTIRAPNARQGHPHPEPSQADPEASDKSNNNVLIICTLLLVPEKGENCFTMTTLQVHPHTLDNGETATDNNKCHERASTGGGDGFAIFYFWLTSGLLLVKFGLTLG